jgi:hypothetical protein
MIELSYCQRGMIKAVLLISRTTTTTMKCNRYKRIIDPLDTVQVLLTNRPFFFFFVAISTQNEVTLYNISRHHARRYECIASNGYPPDVARSFQIIIQYPPEVTLLVNEQIAPTSLFSKNHQEEIRLKCQVQMYPSEKIYWTKDERQINNHYRIYQSGNYIISELTVRLLTDADQGSYSCVASNLLGTYSQTIHLSALSRSTTTTTTTKRITARRRRPKYFRVTTPQSPVFYSTESSRMMTVSSAGET